MSERVWDFFCMGCVVGAFLCLLLGVLFCPQAASAETIQSGDTLFVTGDPPAVTIVCDISDGGGIGMANGAAIFGIRYENETNVTWFPERTYEENAIVELPNIVKGKKAKILARFADTLENWMPTEEAIETPSYFMVDKDSPSGAITIKVDTVLNVSSTITIVKPSVK